MNTDTSTGLRQRNKMQPRCSFCLRFTPIISIWGHKCKCDALLSAMTQCNLIQGQQTKINRVDRIKNWTYIIKKLDTCFFPTTNIIAVINLKICCFHFSAIKVMIQMALQILIVVAISIKTKTNPVSAKNHIS